MSKEIFQNEFYVFDGISPEDLAKARKPEGVSWDDIMTAVIVGVLLGTSHLRSGYSKEWCIIPVSVWCVLCILAIAVKLHTRHITAIAYGKVINMETKDMVISGRGFDPDTLPYYYEKSYKYKGITKPLLGSAKTFYYVDVSLESTDGYIRHIPCRKKDFYAMKKGGRVMIVRYGNNDMIALTVSSVSGN